MDSPKLNFVFKSVPDSIDLESLAAIPSLNPEVIDEELRLNPSRGAYWGGLLELHKKHLAELKESRKNLRAKAGSLARMSLAASNPGRVTDKMVVDATDLDPEVQKAETEVLEVDTQCNLLQVLVLKLVEKQQCLQTISVNRRKSEKQF